MRGGSAASCCARWPSSGQPAGCRGTGLRNTRGPYAVSCREGSGSAPPSRTYIPRARGGSCSISSAALHEWTRDRSSWACCLSEVHGNEESRCRKDLLVRIGLRPGRSALGVVPELAEFLRAAAGFGDLRGPLDSGFARRQFQDTEAAVELLGLRVGLVGDGAVGGDHQRRDILVDTTAEHIDAGILRLAYGRVCRFADGSHVFVGDVHRRSGEGDKVLRHRSVLRV